MATRDINDFNSLKEWSTHVINEIPNTSSFIKSLNLFKKNYTNHSAILFDKSIRTNTLLPSVNRRGGKPTYGSDRKTETYSLPLAYFHDMDTVEKADYEGKRQAGSKDNEDTEANVISEKLVDQRSKADQTHEYMMLQALKGICKTPDGVVLANMFTEFNVTKPSVDFLLGTASTDVKAKCAEVLDTMQSNLKSGGTFAGEIPVIVDRSFFNKLVDHDSVKEAYLNSVNNTVYQAVDKTFYEWGISSVFRFNGLIFMVYNHTFSLPDGTTEVGVDTDTGHVVPRLSGNNSIFQAWYGPSRKMTSNGGAEMFVWEYRDPKGFYHDIDLETSALMFCEKPLTLVEVTTSN